MNAYNKTEDIDADYPFSCSFVPFPACKPPISSLRPSLSENTCHPADPQLPWEAQLGQPLVSITWNHMNGVLLILHLSHDTAPLLRLRLRVKCPSGSGWLRMRAKSSDSCSTSLITRFAWAKFLIYTKSLFDLKSLIPLLKELWEIRRVNLTQVPCPFLFPKYNQPAKLPWSWLLWPKPPGLGSWV